MTQQLRDLRQGCRDAVCRARAVDRVISTEEFEETWDKADAASRLVVEKYVAKLDKEGVELWLREQRSEDYGSLSLRELRAVGQRLRIRRYNCLPKASLLSEIANATK